MEGQIVSTGAGAQGDMVNTEMMQCCDMMAAHGQLRCEIHDDGQNRKRDEQDESQHRPCFGKIIICLILANYCCEHGG